MQVLLVDPGAGLPPDTAACLAEDGWDVRTARDYRAANRIAREEGVAAVIVPQPREDRGEGPGTGDYRDLLRTIDTRRLAAVLIADEPQGVGLNGDSLVDVTSRSVTKDEIRGRLATIRRYHALVRGMEREVENLQRISKRINQHLTELDDQMRLAGRLQRDFLPRRLGPIGPVRFAPLYRPVSWVSGDIYDIFRIDEKHVGFYIADAVGHGMAAGLLTMFIKQALVPKEITAAGYHILDPGAALARLNETLTEQELPNCQFVTVCYCVLDLETLELSYARGGHPYPLLLGREGWVTELKTSGGLMGLFKEAVFPSAKVQLRPGEKLILYTDGIEVSFAPREDEPHSWEHYRAVFEGLAHEPIEEMVRQLGAQLDAETGSLHPKDDVTIVAMQIASETE